VPGWSSNGGAGTALIGDCLPMGVSKALLHARLAIELEDITRVFGLVPAVVRVDLVVERGESVLLQGPNGAGKSTLLRILATAISPSDGAGRILGFDLRHERDQIRRRVDLLSHSPRLYEQLTPAENLRFTCSLFDLNPGDVIPALERVGLHRVADERVATFSQGMRQRVALARVLLRSPELLLLDEPYAGLDQEAKFFVDEVIRDARAEERTVIVATHEVDRVSFATRILHMESGRVLETVRPAVAAGGSP
jgi:heme exporter protein A